MHQVLGCFCSVETQIGKLNLQKPCSEAEMELKGEPWCQLLTVGLTLSAPGAYYLLNSSFFLNPRFSSQARRCHTAPRELPEHLELLRATLSPAAPRVAEPCPYFHVLYLFLPLFRPSSAGPPHTELRGTAARPLSPLNCEGGGRARGLRAL